MYEQWQLRAKIVADPEILFRAKMKENDVSATRDNFLE